LGQRWTANAVRIASGTRDGETVAAESIIILKNGEEIAMRKSIMLSATALSFAVAAWLLLSALGQDAVAQSGPLYVNVVDLQIAPDQIEKFIAAAKDNGVTAVKEPGCREFDIAVSSKDPNHIVLFEVWENAAALDAHRATEQTW
jgi:quinol monooxygenase YgiN